MFKKNKKINHYKKIIRFAGGNMTSNLDTNLTLEELENYYMKILKKGCFIEADEGQNKTFIFNSKNVILVEIQKIDEGDK